MPVALAFCGLLGGASLAAGAAAATEGSSTSTSTAPASRFAAPESSLTNGPCTADAPCALSYAVNGAASGQDVTVEPGTYQVTAGLQPKAGVTIHGADGQPAPILVGAANLGGADVVKLSSGSAITHLDIQANAPKQRALELDSATGDDLLLSASGVVGDAADAAVLLVGSPSPSPLALLRDSVAWSTGSGMPAVVLQTNPSGADAPLDLVNVTAVASGGGSTAVSSLAPAAAVSLTDLIARGAAADLASSGAPMAVAYSDFRTSQSSGFTDGGGNISADPQFADPANGDFHELPGSPTVDIGTMTPLSGTVDPDGNPRQDGATPPDMGAYELVSAQLAASAPGTGLPGGSAGAGSGGAPGAGAPGSGPAPTLLALPVAGRTFDVLPDSGHVLVRAPGAHAFAALSSAQQLPVGSTVDTTSGSVRLVSARDLQGTPQTARFWGGVFRVEQARTSSPLTRLSLVGPLSGCPRSVAGAGRPRYLAIASARRSRRPRSRLLWGSDNHGQFSTRGNNAVATVRGTVWMVKDTCAGTLTRVLAGKVVVRNLHNGRRFTVTAGHSHLVRSRP